MKKLIYYLVAGLLICQSSCITRAYYGPETTEWQEHQMPAEAPLYTVYLLGDAGDPSMDPPEPTLQILKKQMAGQPNSALVVLGDNIYHDGLPPEGHHDRENSERKLVEQLKVVENHPGKVAFIPGNHDWNYMREGGLKRVNLQEQFVENYLNKGNTYVPDNGCPGPVEIELSPEVVLLVLDTQWWLHQHEKPYGRFSGCAAANEAEMLRLLSQMLERNSSKHVIVAAHHPLMSNSNHGGYYSVLDHLFPLTLIRDELYVPIPVVGSLYPFYRMYGGVDQDIPHYRYQLLIDELMRVFRHHDNVVFAAGHEHALQLHRTEKLIHVVSGSGCKTSHIVEGNNAEFVAREKGFAKIMYYPNSEAWIEYWTEGSNGTEGKLSYRTRLYVGRRNTDFCDPAENDDLPATVTVAADTVSEARLQLGRAFYGRHYTREWTTPVNIPVVDLQDTAGGLTPYNTTGSEYHKSLRLRNSANQEFLFRSLDRSVLKVVPEEYRQSRSLENQTRNHVMLQHPYAPLIVAPLERAAGLPFNHPELVTLPDSECLGPWQQNFAGTIGYMEEQAEDQHLEKPENIAFPGQSLEYESLIDALERNQNHWINEPTFAKLRLLDMLVGDWDRHEHQYHWIGIRTKGGIEYLPVADDRDNAFFSFQGPLPWLISRRWAFRNLQNFNGKIKDLKGLNNSARTMDRRFLTSLSREDWRTIAAELQNSLTDQALGDAVKKTPPEVFPINGPKIINHLKTRREQLPEVADRYYELLARYVDVYGSDSSELFVIDHLSKRETQISVFVIDSTGTQGRKRYDRVFNRKETKEIRLYGLEGNDLFRISGTNDSKIKIRVIGGKGLDRAGDTTLISSTRGRTKVYDEGENPYVLDHTARTNLDYPSGEISSQPSTDRFFYNYLGPRLVFRYNQDDGLMPGAGATFRTYKFRSFPYGTEHRLLYHYAFGTNSGRISYTGNFNKLYRNYDLVINTWGYTPYYVMNYYGWGNESIGATDTNDEYYRARLHHTYINISLNKSFATFFTLGVGPKFEYFRLSNWEGKYYTDRVSELERNPFSSKKYVGLRAFIETNIKDNIYNPTRGLVLKAEANLNEGLSKNTPNYSHYSYEAGYYMSPSWPFQLTFAGRLGGAFNTGTYDFYQANMLGGGTLPDLSQNLRGFPKTRFIGKSSLYTNLELRVSLLQSRLYLLPVKTGVLGLYDAGRVWANGEKSDTWHRAYGGGIWISILNRITISATMAHSKEGNFINIQNGFFF
ncbi:outer membrane protein/protective antigen OMA87 [Flammeovirgaceae bacterium 311]|nr:outer membrane protein/protective antigen OMA87 [Flammeovirgaceae bacterium 311]